MALPSSGSISLQQANLELGLSSTAQVSLDQSVIRNLFGISNGLISLQDGYGKANSFSFTKTIASDTTNYNIKSDALASGWDGVIALIANITINAGIVVSATDTTIPAFDTGITFPSGSSFSITNNGSILGKGGLGGIGGTNSGNGASGSIGGPAFKAQVTTTLNNIGTIGSGGGGQGGGGAVRTGSVTGVVSALCGGGLICGQANCNIGACDTNVGSTGATGTSNGINGAVGTSGSSASFGTAVICSTNGCTGAGCNRKVTCSPGSPGTGGLAGASIIGNTNITYINTGTRNGQIT